MVSMTIPVSFDMYDIAYSLLRWLRDVAPSQLEVLHFCLSAKQVSSDINGIFPNCIYPCECWVF